MKAKALQLADEVLAKEYAPRLEIAKELRRLHLENEQLKSREWVGLTDEEITELHHKIKVRLMGTFDTKDIYRAVEQALKEKNT